ncbi:MAG: gamma-glutamylcyclotransferase family protein [Rhodospirillales bacterium]
MEFFFYGTLMDDDVLSRVVGRRLPPASIESASLLGYKRVYADKALYPVLVPFEGGWTDGHLVGGLAPVELERIFAFEDEGYVAQLMAVSGVRSGEAQALVFMPGSDMKITSRAWHYDEWRRHHKGLYLQRIWGKA